MATQWTQSASQSPPHGTTATEDPAPTHLSALGPCLSPSLDTLEAQRLRQVPTVPASLPQACAPLSPRPGTLVTGHSDQPPHWSLLTFSRPCRVLTSSGKAPLPWPGCVHPPTLSQLSPRQPAGVRRLHAVIWSPLWDSDLLQDLRFLCLQRVLRELRRHTCFLATLAWK